MWFVGRADRANTASEDSPAEGWTCNYLECGKCQLRIRRGVQALAFVQVCVERPYLTLCPVCYNLYVLEQLVAHGRLTADERELVRSTVAELHAIVFEGARRRAAEAQVADVATSSQSEAPLVEAASASQSE